MGGGFLVLRHGSACLQGFQRRLSNCWAGPSSGLLSLPPLLGEGLRNAAWVLGSYGLQPMDKGARELPSQPSLALAGCAGSHWLGEKGLLSTETKRRLKSF